MTAHHYTEISCDAPGCRAAYSNSGHAYQVREQAAKLNWTTGTRGDYCPDHRTRASRMFIQDTAGNVA